MQNGPLPFKGQASENVVIKLVKPGHMV